MSLTSPASEGWFFTTSDTWGASGHLYVKSKIYNKLVNITIKEADSQIQRMNKRLPVGTNERGNIGIGD